MFVLFGQLSSMAREDHRLVNSRLPYLLVNIPLPSH